MHAGELDGSLAFWAEASGPEEGPGGGRPRGRRGRKSPDGGSARGARGYGFSASPHQLRALLRSMGLDPRAISRARIWLPTVAAPTARKGGADARPVPSSEYVAGTAMAAAAAEEGKASKSPVMRPWAVNVARLSGGDAAALLCRVMGRRTTEPGVVVGADLSYLSRAMRLAGSLVARQQYLPDVAAAGGDDAGGGEGGGGAYDAAWNPLLVGRDSERFEALSGGMPGAVRAFSDGDAVPEDAPHAVLLRIVTRLVSHMVRAAASAGLPPTFHRLKRFDSAHDRWMHELKTTRPRAIEGPDAPGLSDQVREWRRPIVASAGSPLRLCFRLEEPDGAEDEWFVRYLVQSRDDPSLMVPADRAWRSRSSQLPGGANAREFLLMSLGRASGIFGGIAEGMGRAGAGSGIDGCAIDGCAAYRFLTEEASALEQAGYGVLLPAWWTSRGRARARLRARADVRAPKMSTGGMLSLETIVLFDWEVAMGDKKITLAQLRKLAKAKSPLVRMRGEWMEVAPEDIRSAVKFLEGGTGKAPLRDVVMMGLGGAAGGAAGAGTLDIDVSSGDGGILGVLQGLGDRTALEDAAQPHGFEGTLRPYQVRGLSWLLFLQKWGLGGCLADDMGLGKTPQTLALIQQHRLDGGRGPFLLVCPTSVIGNWQREASRFTPGLSVMVHHGASRRSGAAFRREAGRHDVVVSSYGLLQRDIETIKGAEWGGMVLDEAQNIKNPETKQSRAARAVDAGARFALTGTPVENNVGDLWSIMEFLNPGLLGTQAEFRRNFFVPIQSAGDEEAAERLRRATGPFILRRLKTDKSVIADLPEKMEMKTYCSLTKEQASLYAAVLREIGDALDGAGGEGDGGGIRRKGLILAALAKLKQVCCHPAVFLKDNSGISGGSGGPRSGKLGRLTEMLAEVVESGDSALVFTQFVEMGHILRRHIQESFGREVMFLHGGVPRGRRDRMVQKFQDGRGPRIFVISLKAGGTGLNLTAASHVFHFDRWWNPAVEDQATDRAFRIGQKQNVQVHKMICSGTLEERIDEMIERKKDVSRKVVGAGEDWLTEMSNEDLRGILALSAEAAAAEGEGE